MSDSRASSGVRTLRGEVTRGYGHASTTLERAKPRISERMGLGALWRGTLNVRLAEDYQMQNEIVLAPHDVNDVDELVVQPALPRWWNAVRTCPALSRPSKSRLGQQSAQRAGNHERATSLRRVGIGERVGRGDRG